MPPGGEANDCVVPGATVSTRTNAGAEYGLAWSKASNVVTRQYQAPSGIAGVCQNESGVITVWLSRAIVAKSDRSLTWTSNPRAGSPSKSEYVQSSRRLEALTHDPPTGAVATGILTVFRSYEIVKSLKYGVKAGDPENMTTRTWRYRARGEVIGKVPCATGADQADHVASGAPLSPVRVRTVTLENGFVAAFDVIVVHTVPRFPVSRTFSRTLLRWVKA